MEDEPHVFFHNPNLCLGLGLIDAEAFHLILLLSKSINVLLTPLLPLIEAAHPNYGLYLLFKKRTYCHELDDLDPTLHSNLVHQVFALEKWKLPSISICNDFEKYQKPTDLTRFDYDVDHYDIHRYGLPLFPCVANPHGVNCTYLNELSDPLENPNVGEMCVFMVYRARQRRRLSGTSVKHNSVFYYYKQLHGGKSKILATSDHVNFYPLANSLPQFLTDLHVIDTLQRGGCHAYAQELIRVWPKNLKKFEYNFCKICRAGRAPLKSFCACSCTICDDFRVCSNCYEAEKKRVADQSESRLHPHDLWRVWHDRCLSCATLLRPYNGYHFRCDNLNNEHEDHVVCLACLEAGRARHSECLCIVDYEAKKLFCNVCSRDIANSKFQHSISCVDCATAGGSYDICSDCIDKKRWAEKYLKKLSKGQKSKQANNRQLSKKQYKQIAKDTLRRIELRTSARHHLKRFSKHEQQLGHHQWAPTLDPIDCANCLSVCTNDRWLCAKCHLNFCPKCEFCLKDYHQEHRIIHYINQYPVAASQYFN